MKNRIVLLLSIFGLLITNISGQNFDKVAVAARIHESKPKIDGKVEEQVWQQVKVVDSFTQFDPVHGEATSYETRVRFLYDDEALYVSAMMFDPAPDSILKELDERDNYPNADRFEIKLDTYLNQQDAYVFGLSASGVQFDHRHQDRSYSAVWESAVEINSEGWFVEMRIPYSAFRFPEKEKQEWGLQIIRSVRRTRERDVWAFMEKGLPDYMNYWGVLTGIENVDPPVRLSLTPYFSAQKKYFPDENGDIINGRSIGGGLDLRYGINESFTADVTLLPDFSQVKSDNPVKNLSAFETVHAERRPFFIESMDLFKRGGLFYSRRIGQKPSGYYDVDSEIDSTGEIIENPAKAELVNAAKFYGRNKSGTGIGVLNAITAQSFAKVQSEDGEIDKYRTGPLTNYNIAVVDQPLKNNSNIYLINTNVYRQGDFDKANVTGFGTDLKDKENDFSIEARGSLSQRYTAKENQEKYESLFGYQYYLALRKISGNFRFRIFRDVKDDDYNINDMGVNHRNNYYTNGVRFDYRKYEPFSVFRYFSNYVTLRKTEDFSTHENIDFKLRYGGYATLKSYTSFWYHLNYSIQERYDYYDPRVEDRYIVRPPYFNTSLGLSTDYRKPLAFNSNFYVALDQQEYYMTSISLGPRVRVNDRLSFNYNMKLQQQDNSLGYVTQEEDDRIIYGRRNLSTFENTLNSRLMLKSNLSVSLWMRHYWYQGDYQEYFELTQNGELSDSNGYEENNDFNFNAFNLDLMLNWRFAPGSNMSLVWKNEITSEDDYLVQDFYKNIKNTFDAPQTNIISLKILYYLDYQNLNIFGEKG